MKVRKENNPVPIMHDRHWVGRNRGKNLESEMSVGKRGKDVNAIVKVRRKLPNRVFDNVNARVRLFASACFLISVLAHVPDQLKAEELHFGPFYDRSQLTLESGERTEVAAPFFYEEKNETQRIWAFPPFLSFTRDLG